MATLEMSFLQASIYSIQLSVLCLLVCGCSQETKISTKKMCVVYECQSQEIKDSCSFLELRQEANVYRILCNNCGVADYADTFSFIIRPSLPVLVFFKTKDTTILQNLIISDTSGSLTVRYTSHYVRKIDAQVYGSDFNFDSTYRVERRFELLQRRRP